MTDRYLLRIVSGSEVVAEAPLIVHNKEKTLAVLDAVEAPWGAITLQGVRSLVSFEEQHEVKLLVGIELQAPAAWTPDNV